MITDIDMMHFVYVLRTKAINTKLGPKSSFSGAFVSEHVRAAISYCDFRKSVLDLG